MAVKPTEQGGTFDPAAAKASRQRMIDARRQEILSQASSQKPQPAATAVQQSAPEPQANTQPIGTGYTNSALTQEKVLVIAAKNKQQGDYVGSLLLGTKQTVPGTPQQASLNPQTQPIDRHTKNLLQTIFSPEVATAKATADQVDARAEKAGSSLSISGVSNSIAGGIDKLGNELDHGVAGVKEDLSNILKPISSFTGSTLGSLNNVVNNPLGAPLLLGNAMASLVDKVNPDFMNKIDAAFKQFKSSELAHLPGQMMGSIQKLVTAADKLLAVPANLVSDLYGGLMKIMQAISKLVDKLLAMVQNFFFGPQGILDQILPMDMIKSVLSAVGEIGSMAGNLSQVFGGFGMAQNITSQLQSFTSQGNAFLQNPMSIASAYMPPQIGGVVSTIRSGSGGLEGITQAFGNISGKGSQINTAISALRDPSQMLSKFVPPQLMSQMGKLSQIPGLGSVGNMGFGLGSTLDSLKEGVISKTLSQFTQQSGILGPLLNKQGTAPPIYSPTESKDVAITGAAVNPSVPTVQGVPIQTSPRPSIFPQA